jgi:hypothetical protein
MAHRSKSVSLAATILSALLSLRSVSALSNPSHALPRIKRHLAIASSRSSFHRRHTHIPKRCLVSAAAKANDSDSTDSSHHQRLHQRLMDLNFTFAVEDSESLFFEDSESLLFEPSLKKPSVVVAFLSDLSLIYSDLLERRPFITNGITAGVLAAVGDLVAQSESIQMAHDVTAVSVPFNWVRTLTFLLTSLLFEGPWMHAWYESLWKIGCWMETRFQFGPPLQIAAQIFIDQSIGVFLLYPLYFMVYECVGAALSGRGMSMSMCCGEI